MENGSAVGVLNALASLRSDADSAAHAKEATEKQLAEFELSLKLSVRTVSQLTEQIRALQRRIEIEEPKQVAADERVSFAKHALISHQQVQTARVAASGEFSDWFKKTSDLHCSQSRTFREFLKLEVEKQQRLQHELYELDNKEKVDEENLIKEKVFLESCEKDIENILGIQQSKSSTLEEAKRALNHLRTERTKAEASEAILKTRCQEQKQTAQDLASMLQAIKKENGNLRFGIRRAQLAVTQSSATNKQFGQPYHHHHDSHYVPSANSKNQGRQLQQHCIESINYSSKYEQQQQHLLKQYNKNRETMTKFQPQFRTANQELAYQNPHLMLLEATTGGNQVHEPGKNTVLLCASEDVHGDSFQNDADPPMVATETMDTTSCSTQPLAGLELEESPPQKQGDDDDDDDELLSFRPFEN